MVLGNPLVCFGLSFYGLRITLGRQSLARTSYTPDMHREPPVDILESAAAHVAAAGRRHRRSGGVTTMMDFSPSPEQQERIEKARAFTREWISPNAAKHDRSGEFPLDICREAFKQGLMNPHIPKEYGGLAEPVLDHCMVMEELCTGCSGIGTVIDANGLSQFPVILAGTDEQKRRFLAPMTEELMFSAYAVTEPEAGSDVSRVKTTAVKVGNDYVLNGVKWWITSGSVASWYFVLARVGEEPTGFVVPADSPGHRARPQGAQPRPARLEHGARHVRGRQGPRGVPARRRGRRLQHRHGDLQPHPPGGGRRRQRHHQGRAQHRACPTPSAAAPSTRSSSRTRASRSSWRR